LIEVVRHAGPGSFLERAEEWLLRGEDRHNLILSLSYARARGEADSEGSFFATVEQDRDVAGCLVRTPPHKVLITGLPPGSGPPVARALAEAFDEIPAVLGPMRDAQDVAASWAEERGGKWRSGLAQRIYRLDEVRAPAGVPGALREATVDDLGLAVRWGEGFSRDAGVQFAIRRASIERWIERRSLFIWEHGEPRSIAVAQGRTPHGIRIGYVYTPPELRGRGYAGATVAEVSQRMLASGLSFCVLYTDRGNPTSNSLYQRLGYYAIADVCDVEILPAELG
jgi:ribosomal protein S18 acetylase RimI-like enzyme